jgi:hypothetical protein
MVRQIGVALALGSVLLVFGCADHPADPTLLASAGQGTTSPASTAIPAGSPWRTVPVGTVYETETATKLTNGAVAPMVKTRQTVLAKDEQGVTLKIESGMVGEATKPLEVKVPYVLPEYKPKTQQDGCPIPVGSKERPLPIMPTSEKSNEKCTVPAGTFQCVKTRLEVRQGKVSALTETWMAQDVPVAVQSITTNQAMVSTMRLTKVVTPKS